jgi:hypothetical protein
MKTGGYTDVVYPPERREIFYEYIYMDKKIGIHTAFILPFTRFNHTAIV